MNDEVTLSAPHCASDSGRPVTLIRPLLFNGLLGTMSRSCADAQVRVAKQIGDSGAARDSVPRDDFFVAPLASFRKGQFWERFKQ
jgi:hypothetical protein